jgi:hypothetical protein
MRMLSAFREESSENALSSDVPAFISARDGIFKDDPL